jgi:hypothetical protein
MDIWPVFMDEYSVYNRSLSSNEIAKIFAAGSAGKCLLGRFRDQPIHRGRRGGTSSDSVFSLRGTFGSRTRARMNGDAFTLRGGFWRTPFPCAAAVVNHAVERRGDHFLADHRDERCRAGNSDLGTTNWMDVRWIQPPTA